VKLSVSLSAKDVEFIDRYASVHRFESRSGVLQRAVLMLRASELGEDYAAAWAEWAPSEGASWDSTVGDGLSNAG